MKLVPKRKVVDREGFSSTIMNLRQDYQDTITNITEESTLVDSGLAFIIDGGGSVIDTGEHGHLVVPFNCEITAAELEADQSGSIKIDIWKDTYTNFPPTNADTITGGSEPEISSATKDYDSTLSGWTTNISKGDVLAFNVDSVATIERVTITLYVRKV